MEGYVLVDCNFFFSVHLHAYWQFNEVIMFIIAICCPNNIWLLEDNGINTILPSDVKILFPDEHLSEFVLEGELIVCILMQEHCQGIFLSCRNIFFSPFFKNVSILSVGHLSNMCKRVACLYEPSWISFWLRMPQCGVFSTVLFCDSSKI